MLTKFLLALISFLLSFSPDTYAQTKKLNIQSLDVAVYKYNSIYSKVQDQADVHFYCNIKGDGTAAIQAVTEEGVKFYKFKVPDSIISEMGLLFNGKKKLKDFYAKGMPEKGVIYGAQQYHYIKLTDMNGASEAACYVNDFMTDVFNQLVREVEQLQEGRNPVTTAKEIVTREIIHKITDLHKQTKALTTAGGPPPQEGF